MRLTLVIARLLISGRYIYVYTCVCLRVRWYIAHVIRGCCLGCDDEVYIAFAIPWSLSQDAASLSRAQQRFDSASRPFIFTREELCLSLEGRPVDVLTITSAETGREERPVFIVTSRVHPGETPASHMCNGILDFLLRIRDERARAARKAFVFKIVTIINPDGVANGHYRCDTRYVDRD